MALAAVLALFAWQQGGDGDGGGPLNAIAAAAEKTQGEPGGRSTVRMVVTSSDGSAPLTITGHTTYSAGRTRGVLRFVDPDSGEPGEMQMAAEGTTVYMRSSLFDGLPGGKEWMAFDFSFLEGPDAPFPASSDAKSELALLEAATGGVEKLGEEDVRGVPTTRYRGTLDISEAAARLREKGAEELADQIEAGPPPELEAWIDADGLVRRMRIVRTQPEPEGEGTTTVDMRMDLFDLGLEPEIEIPDSSEVFDATDLIKEEAGISDDG